MFLRKKYRVHTLLFLSPFPKGVLLPSKRSPFAFQNESFCPLKGVLLHFKTSPFATQKESFLKPAALRLRFGASFNAL